MLHLQDGHQSAASDLAFPDALSLATIGPLFINSAEVREMSTFIGSTTETWVSRPLCRRYAYVVFRASKVKLRTAIEENGPTWWALGTLNDGGSEFLGAWKNADGNAGLPPDVFGQLCERGVLSIRFCIGNIGGAEMVFRETLRHAAIVPSMQELISSADTLVRPRHRVKVARMLRTVAELDNSQAARAKFREFQGSALGERYPEIVHQWDEALSRSEAFYALDAPLRELVRSADRMAADVSECLTRVIKRHGQFSDSTTALDFVVACLEKAERGLDRDRAAALATGRARLSFRRSAASAPGVARVLTLA
ncbi:transposase [Roseateles sp. DC23W]|uniref:Mutator family transposase n=1 Tax=Pelomonas dachongensis TaxID=3299029 RepID=A0ABW7EXD6_9BURK